MQDVYEIEDYMAFCHMCHYVFASELWKVKAIHRTKCEVWRMGGDCMCFEGKTHCECAK